MMSTSRRVAVFATLITGLLLSAAAIAGNKGPIRVGRRGIFDGEIEQTTKRGGVVQGRFTSVGKGVPKGTGARLAHDFGMQEVLHGPRNDETLFERSIHLQNPRDYVPYSDGGPPLSYSRGARSRYSSSSSGICDCANCNCVNCDCVNCDGVDCWCDEGGGGDQTVVWSSARASSGQAYGASGQSFLLTGQDGRPVATVELIDRAQLSVRSW